MQSKTTTLNGVTMRWEEHGDGMPLVLLHGIPTSPALWRHVIPRIEGAKCLAWEMVGYGTSIPEGRNRDISVARQADYLIEWLRHLGIEKAVFAGHDLGGGVAQIAATRHPWMCAGLLLTNAIGYDSWPIPSVKMMRAAAPVVRRLPNLVFHQVVSTFIRRGHDDGGAADEAIAAHWPHYAQHGGGRAFVRQIEALDVRDTLAVADDLTRLGVPARVVWGEADQFQKLEYGERFARDLKAPLRRIEGGKHFTPEDHPEIIAEEINLLLRESQTAEIAGPRLAAGSEGKTR
ncbi:MULTISPECIES: alpha/beta fold hydrolase [unclassified Aurantimonas]|uniref:alpha/beta fold hydrolase n=1 Tax=unclassified Aurantimonas TaxID=2638230 RepID=UPI002E18667E|nr:alpha/beta fold hydrolase [Aurantimonas sp. A3-2-R12]